jgi:hypothetical protein
MQLRWIRFTVAVSLCAASGFGQYPMGTPGYNPPSGGYHSSTGIAIGAGAAAGIGIGYLVLRNHNRAKISGCLQASDHAETQLDDENKTYNQIISESVPLKSGERVELRGKRVRSPGTLAFEVQGMVKDYGQCRQ